MTTKTIQQIAAERAKYVSEWHTAAAGRNLAEKEMVENIKGFTNSDNVKLAERYLEGAVFSVKALNHPFLLYVWVPDNGKISFSTIHMQEDRKRIEHLVDVSSSLRSQWFDFLMKVIIK